MKLWYYKQEGKNGVYGIFNPNAKLNTFVCRVCNEEDAKAIVTAVNCHEGLRGACRKALRWHQGDKWRNSADSEEQESWETQRDCLQQALKKVGE